MSKQDEALLYTGRLLKRTGYRFITPTPLTHQRVLARAAPPQGDGLARMFGWNCPFAAHEMEDDLRRYLEEACLLEHRTDGKLRCLFRFSSLDDLLLVHSPFPTVESDAVFFGPDTYRFARAIRRLAETAPNFRPRTAIDVGAGSGAGGLCLARLFPKLGQVVLTDINARALGFAEVNARLNQIPIAKSCFSDVLEGLGKADLIVSNPPYLVDEKQRAYRHGGGPWGFALALRIVDQALQHLMEGGRLLLYTGTPIVGGKDLFLDAIWPLLEGHTYSYEETDPDVFGEELEKPPYDKADRIATIVLNVKVETRP